jgi:hypothetical protein
LLGGAATANQKSLGRIAKKFAEGEKIETTIDDCVGKLLARGAPPAESQCSQGGSYCDETHAIMILQAG